MGIPLVQDCNPDIQSCHPTSSPESICKAPEALCEPVESSRPACKLPEKFQATSPFFSSLWAPTAAPGFNTEAVFLSQAEREKVLGPYLAELPRSAEEARPTDTSKALLSDTTYSLQEAWPHLPLQVRVYLDSYQLRSDPQLNVAYESASPDFPEGRWHVFKKEASSGTEGEGKEPIAMAGMGVGVLTLLNKPLSKAPLAPAEAPPPRGNPSFNLKLGSFLAGSAIVVGIDLGIQKAFPYMPAETRIIPNLGTFYGLQYVMWQSGFIKAGSWGEVWRPSTSALPAMAVLGVPTSLLVDKIGQAFKLRMLRSDGELHGPVTALGTLGVYWGLMKTAAGRSFLTATGGGLAGTLGKVARVGGAALILSALCRGAKAGGSYLGMLMGGARPGEYAWRDGLLRMEAEKIELAKLSQDALGETGGSVVDATIGGLLDAILTIGELVSDDVQRGRQMEIDEVEGQLIDEGRKAAEEIQEKLALVLSASTSEDGNIDWDKAQAGIREIYGNAGVMEAIYKNFAITGQRVDEAEEIRLSVMENGEITDKDRLLKMAQSHAKNWVAGHQKELTAKRSRLEKLGEEIGAIKRVGNQLFLVPPQLLDENQRARMEKEYLPLSGEVSQMEMMNEQMGHLKSNIKGK